MDSSLIISTIIKKINEIESEISSLSSIHIIEKDLLLSEMRNLYAKTITLQLEKEVEKIPHEKQILIDNEANNKKEDIVIIPEKILIEEIIPEKEILKEEIIEVPKNEEPIIIEEKKIITIDEEKIIPIINEVPQVVVVTIQPEEPQISEIKQDVPIENPISKAKESEPKKEKPVHKKEDKKSVEEKQTVSDLFINSGSSTIGEMMEKIKSEKDLTSRLTKTPISNLKSGISINERVMFSRELFGNNSELFNKTIDELNSLSTLEDAFEKLSSIIQVNIENDAFQQFMKILYRRFLATNKSLQP